MVGVSFLSMLWSVVQVVLIPIALGIVLQIINRKIAEKLLQLCRLYQLLLFH